MRKTFRASLLFSALLLGSAGMAMAQGTVQGAVQGAVQGPAAGTAPGTVAGPAATAATAPSQAQPGSQPRAHATSTAKTPVVHTDHAGGARHATRHEAASPAGTPEAAKAEGHAATAKHHRSGKASLSSHAAEQAPEAGQAPAGKAPGQVARSQPAPGPATEAPATHVN